jgi:hypothetical protein
MRIKATHSLFFFEVGAGTSVPSSRGSALTRTARVRALPSLTVWSVIFQRVDSTSTFYILYPLVEVLLTLTLAAAAGEEVYRIVVVSVRYRVRLVGSSGRPACASARRAAPAGSP